jgi:hypothetical protein
MHSSLSSSYTESTDSLETQDDLDLVASKISMAPTQAAAAELARRSWLITRVGWLRAQGWTHADACSHVGISTTTWWRYRRSLAAKGFAGLIPGVGTGRPDLLAGLGLSDGAQEQIRTFSRAAGLGIGPAALTWAAGRGCSEASRVAIRRRFDSNEKN